MPYQPPMSSFYPSAPYPTWTLNQEMGNPSQARQSTEEKGAARRTGWWVINKRQLNCTILKDINLRGKRHFEDRNIPASHGSALHVTGKNDSCFETLFLPLSPLHSITAGKSCQMYKTAAAVLSPVSQHPLITKTRKQQPRFIAKQQTA